MKQERWVRAVQRTALVFGYLWYNANIHFVVTRALF
jgi:hypothetical protein